MTIPKQDTRSGKEDGHDVEAYIHLLTFESYIILDSVCTFRSLSGNVLDLFFLVQYLCAHLIRSVKEQTVGPCWASCKLQSHMLGTITI